MTKVDFLPQLHFASRLLSNESTNDDKKLRFKRLNLVFKNQSFVSSSVWILLNFVGRRGS